MGYFVTRQGQDTDRDVTLRGTDWVVLAHSVLADLSDPMERDAQRLGTTVCPAGGRLCAKAPALSAHKMLVTNMARPKIVLAKDHKSRKFLLSQFSVDAQIQIKREIERHRRLAELTQSFPALLMVLARADDADPRKIDAIAQIEAGATVFEVASPFGLARWTSYLAPATVSDVTPHALPDDADFNAEIVNFLPAEVAFQRGWLPAIAAAYHWGGRAFALWLARHMAEGLPPPHALVVQLIAFYYCITLAPQTLPARMMQKRWHAKQSFQSAAFETHYWLSWVIVHALLGPQGQQQNWRQNGVAHGYRFVALQTAVDFKGAAERSDNCLYKYADCLLREWGHRVFDIIEEHSGALVGHVEIGFDVTHGIFLRPMQIRGHANRALTDDIARSVYAWLAEAPSLGGMPNGNVHGDRLLERMARDRLPSVPSSRVAENWEALFGCYITEHGVPAGMSHPPTMLDIVALHKRSGALKEWALQPEAAFGAALRRLTQRVEHDNSGP